MIELTLKLREDQLETLLECVRTAAAVHSANSLIAIQTNNPAQYAEANTKKTESWKLYDYILRRTVD